MGSIITIQAAQLLVEGLGLGAWVFQAVVIVLIAAVPLVVGLAWTFDLTPRGVEVTGKQPTDSRLAVTWERAALPLTASILVLIIALALMMLV